MPIRLLVIDFGSPYIANLLEVLTPEHGVEIAGRATDLDSLTRLASEATTDVVLVDIDLIAESNDEYLERVPELFPDADVFLITGREEVQELRQAERSPAIGLIATDAEPHNVLAAIRNTAADGIAVHREYIPGLVNRLRHFPRRVPQVTKGNSPLTPRETEVLAMLSHGTHVDAIARELNLSVHTVRGHVKTILAKLDSHSQLEAVAKAKERGWIPGDA